MRPIALVLLTALTACAGFDSVSPEGSSEEVPPALPLHLWPVGDPAALVVDGAMQISAIEADQYETRRVSPSWISTNPAVATVYSVFGNSITVRGVAAGATTIVATAQDGATASVQVTVLQPPSLGMGSVQIRNFQLLEYPDPPSSFVYVPIGVIEATAGQVDVTSMSLTIPGLSVKPRVCSSIRLDPGATRPINIDYYGDWGYSVYGDRGRRSSGPTATVTLAFRTSAGAGTLQVEGPIIVGGPTTLGDNGVAWISC